MGFIKKIFHKLASFDGRVACIWLLCLILLTMIGFFFYLFWQKPLLQQQLDVKQGELMLLSKGIIETSKNQDYQRYQIAKMIEKQSDPLLRGDAVKELVATFEKLQTIYSATELGINDFQINFDKISVKGSVENLNTVYATGGVLDTFSNLSFLDTIDIPYYKKYGGRYEFLLEGTIKDSGKR